MVQIIDAYELRLDLFYEEIPKFKDIISEIPMDKIDVLMDKMSIIIQNSTYDKEYVFDNFNANTFIIGANFGPYTSEEFLFHAIQQISKTRDCCLRDRYSYNLLSKQLSNVRYAPDILFGYSYLPKEKSGNR